MTRPTHLHTRDDAVLLAAAFERDWSMALDIAHVAVDGREMLAPEHEGDLLAEYGPEALIRYYSPGDPRLSPLEST